MQRLRQLGIGVIIAVVSVILVLGGVFLSLAENVPAPSTPTQIPPTLPLEFPTPTATTISLPTLSETPTPTQTATVPPTNTLLAAAPTQCIPPVGWIQIITAAADTIYSIAQRYKTTAENLSEANCLLSAELPAGTALYVPPVPTVTVIACRPPIGWVKTHIVQPGENLFRIALSYGITYPELQRGNCMGSSTIIYVGQRLWVPNRPTRTPTVPVFPTATNTSTPTEEPTSTATSTSTVTASPTATPTDTPSQ